MVTVKATFSEDCNSNKMDILCICLERKWNCCRINCLNSYLSKESLEWTEKQTVLDQGQNQFCFLILVEIFPWGTTFFYLGASVTEFTVHFTKS